jgi:crotonobetainyl-CoA:carnitine CoA-transferase CaiB-like acyl-CoA transferase
MATKSTAEWVEILESADIPCGPINDYRQVFEDPQVRHRRLRHDMTRADGVPVPLVASPMRLSETPVVYRQAPPVLGEHTATVLADLLGRTHAEIGALKSRGIV